MKIKAIGALSAAQALEPMDISRREPGPHDVQIAIAYCGVCHSDVHQARAEWAGTLFPCVPGHEIVGRVAAVGSDVTVPRTRSSDRQYASPAAPGRDASGRHSARASDLPPVPAATSWFHPGDRSFQTGRG